MGPHDLNPAAPTQVGTGADGQPTYEGNLNDSSRPTDGSSSSSEGDGSQETESPEGSDSNAGDDASAPESVDTGDATFVTAQSDPNPDVVPIAGDSADDPNLGEGGDPAGGVDTGDATFAGMGASGTGPNLPPFDPDTGGGPVTYPPSSDPNAGLPPPPLPTAMRDGQVHRAETRVPDAAPSSRPGWLIPAAVAGLLLLGTVGFAATRGGGDAPAPAPTLAGPTLGAPTAAQTATVARTAAPTAAGAVARVTDTKVTEQGNVCLNQTILTVTAKIDGAKAGDTIVFALSGPGLPATVSGQLDASGGVSATMGTVGPVKGNQTWGAAVKSIAGKDVVSGPSQVFGFCPNN